MRFFKAAIEWFKSGERERIIESGKLSLSTATTKDPQYKTILNIEGVTIVILKDSRVLSKEDPDKTIFNGISRLSENQIIDLFRIHNERDILLKHNSFIIKEDQVYYKGVDIPLPKIIELDFIRILENIEYQCGDDYKDDFNRLSYFWLKLSTSPTGANGSLLNFCEKNDVRLSKTGNVIVYRSVVRYENSLETTKEYSFVKNWYNKIKEWKKSPANYTVFKVNNSLITLSNSKPIKSEYELVGNLKELYLKGDTSKGTQLYTSKHNKGKYSFPIPSLYKMEGEDPDPNLGNCNSGGLHVGSVDFGYSSFGDVPVVCLVNPAKAIYVPAYDDSKFRTTEMYIVGVNPNEHRVHIDEEFIEEADELYNDITLEQLNKVLGENSTESLNIGKNFKSKVSLSDIENIISILNKRTKIIK